MQIYKNNFKKQKRGQLFLKSHPQIIKKKEKRDIIWIFLQVPYII